MQHLLMRGENPDAIRISDMSSPIKEETAGKVDCVKTDITSIDSVQHAFRKPWPKSIASKPLTVFHCAAYISSQDRHRSMLPKFQNVNIKGTENVLTAAHESGASIFIATSSASIAIRPPSYFPYPWQRWPKDIFQVRPNAEPLPSDTPPEGFAACYTWSKMKAEELVLKANRDGFLTGTIRPGHAIYGAAQTTSSVTFDYLQRGGVPSWLTNVVMMLVNAGNVSIAHLAYEDALLKKSHAGGKGYCVTDPNPPIRYGDLYRFLETLAHPLTPIKFPSIPYMPLLLMSYVIEQYVLLQRHSLKWLPQLPADILHVQPATFQLCTLHIIYDDSAARDEIGYKAPVGTLEGLSLALLDWNNQIEKKAKAKVDQGKGSEIKVQDSATRADVPHV